MKTPHLFTRAALAVALLCCLVLAPLARANLGNSASYGSGGVADQSVSSNKLDNVLWESAMAANLAFNRTNLNRYGTSNTFWAIRNSQPLNLLLCGNGWVNAHDGGQFDYVFDGLTNTFGVRGFVSPAFNESGSGRYVPISLSGSWAAQSRNSTWWAPYAELSGSGNGFSCQVSSIGSLAGFKANVFELDYVQNSSGGTFTVATNGGTTWGIVATLNGFNATPQGGVLRWTNVGGPLPSYKMAITNTAAGVNNFVGFGFVNTNVANGVMFVMQTHQGTSPQEYEACPAAVRAPIYKSWDPRLILDIWSVFDNDTWYPATRVFYKTNTPFADVVATSQFWVSYPNPPDPVNLQWACSKTNGFGYFCGMGNIDNPGLAARGGLYGDGGHLSLYGQNVFGKLLWAWMGLNNSIGYSVPSTNKPNFLGPITVYNSETGQTVYVNHNHGPGYDDYGGAMRVFGDTVLQFLSLTGSTVMGQFGDVSHNYDFSTWGNITSGNSLTVTSGLVTNNGVVWISNQSATNSTAYPNGSIATAGGFFWVLQSGVWKQK